MKRERVLVNLSGGIDSVYCLHLMLEQGFNVVAHHIRLRNWEGRGSYEYTAVQAVLKHFERRGLRDRIMYEETGFDYGTLRYVVRDLHIWSFMTAIVLAQTKYADVTKVVVSSHLDSPFMRQPARDARRRALVRNVLNREPEWLYPIGKIAKAEVVKACPADLLALCWYCRTPRAGKPCGRCITCRQVAPALRARDSITHG